MRLPSLPVIQEILELAEASAIAAYSWKDRGVAPFGYTSGMALAYANIVRRFAEGDTAAIDMAKANTHNPDTDALSWYAGIFTKLGMHNDKDGLETLRHLYVLLIGLGMRESSGKHCCGRDQSAENLAADTCEAGLFQMSWNMRSSSPEMDRLFAAYSPGGPLHSQCLLGAFTKGVSCGSDDWESYGSGPGFEYQRLAKVCPSFAVETAAVGLRHRRQHWGPINRYEAEVLVASDELFRAVQEIVLPTPVA